MSIVIRLHFKFFHQIFFFTIRLLIPYAPISLLLNFLNMKSSLFLYQSINLAELQTLPVQFYISKQR